MATEMNLLKLGTGCLDGTRIPANASRHSALSDGHIVKLEVQLKGEVRELLALAEEADGIGTKKPRGKMPRAPEPGVKDSDQINLADEESRIMPVADGGFEQCYKAQAGVDAATSTVSANSKPGRSLDSQVRQAARSCRL
jgi:hypothetical protein